MTESDIQAIEARARPERETTQAIARRVIGAREGDDPTLLALARAGWLAVGRSMSERDEIDLAELLRRAAAGECDPEPR